LLLSLLYFSEFSLGWAEPLGFMLLITWEQSSLKCIREDTDFSESSKGEEWATIAFPLSNAWWDLVFNLLLAWEDCTGDGYG
jgi:hypothetical protein